MLQNKYVPVTTGTCNTYQVTRYPVTCYKKKYVLVTTGTCNTYPVTRFPVTCYKTNMYVTEPTPIIIRERVTSVPKYI